MSSPKTKSGQPLNRFGRWLDIELARLDLTSTELAHRLGIAKHTVYGWRWRSRPSPRACEAIAQVLGVPFATVLDQAGHIRPAPDQPDLRLRCKTLIDLLDPVLLPPLIAQLEGLREYGRLVQHRLAEIHEVAVDLPRDSAAAPSDDHGPEPHDGPRQHSDPDQRV